jgi:hypothetical protein
MREKVLCSSRKVPLIFIVHKKITYFSEDVREMQRMKQKKNSLSRNRHTKKSLCPPSEVPYLIDRSQTSDCF